MSKVRYIKAYECQFCYSTFETEKESNSCCGDHSKYLIGYECKQCFKIHNILEEARVCHPDPKLMSFREFGIDAEDPVDEEDDSDEILIGKTSIINTLKPLEVSYG